MNWAHGYELQTDSGDCKVKVVREEFSYTETYEQTTVHSKDYQIFFLMGDCTDQVVLKFDQRVRFWEKSLFYDGTKTQLTSTVESDGREVREYTLTQGSVDGDRVAARIYKNKKKLSAQVLSGSGIEIDYSDA